MLYAVYGPSAEWADGDGLLAVFRTQREAYAYAKDERRNVINMAIEALLDDGYVPPLDADERRIRRARRRLHAGYGISYPTAAHVLGWPYDGHDYVVVPVGPYDPTYGDLVGWLDEEER
jgi:hypothetical protein